MIKLYSPQNEVELSFIKSILDGEGIPYFVHNDHYGSLKTGPRIDLLNAKTIMVGEEYFDHAKDLIEDFLQKIKPDSKTTGSKYSLFDKMRMIIESLLFGWTMPGKKRSRKNTEK
jgi:hypothetical protein